VTNLFVGIDISMKDFKVQFMNDKGETVAKRRRFLNDQPGLDSLVELILTICLANNIDRIVIGLESTSVYSWHLQMGLASDQRLAQYECQVYPFNPKVVANFKKAYVDLSKDDWTDAWVIADRLRFGRLPENSQVDLRYLPLQRLTRFRYHLMKNITREKNYYLTNLFLKFNTLQQNEIFSDLFGATSEAILTEFLSPDEIAARPLEDLIESVPGFGPASCAGLIAEIGDIRRFPNDSALAKYAGLTWRGHQSGEFEADETPLTKTGNAYLRYYFVQAANSVRQHDLEYHQFYARKFSESKIHHHRRALVLTARKLVRMVDALLRSNQLYKPQGLRSDSA